MDLDNPAEVKAQAEKLARARTPKAYEIADRLIASGEAVGLLVEAIQCSAAFELTAECTDEDCWDDVSGLFGAVATHLGLHEVVAVTEEDQYTQVEYEDMEPHYRDAVLEHREVAGR